ncbi:MAG: hypothetical protein NC342_03990 [Pseudoflavonifractor sp.]|nr:hypothetical protein [Pseudoflavonifractor sp.]
MSTEISGAMTAPSGITLYLIVKVVIRELAVVVNEIELAFPVQEAFFFEVVTPSGIDVSA